MSSLDMEKLLKPAEKVIYDHPSGYGIMDVFHHRYRVQVEKDMVERRKVYRPLMAYVRRIDLTRAITNCWSSLTYRAIVSSPA